jgi:hypothetical protein
VVEESTVRRFVLVAAQAALLSALAATAAQAGNCRDPWITQAIKEVTGREPNGAGESGECTYTQYNGGSWNSYAQLKAAVEGKLRPRPLINLNDQTFAGSGQTVRVAPGTVQQYRVFNGKHQFLANGKWFYLVGNDGGTLIGNDSAGLVGNDGASFRPR